MEDYDRYEDYNCNKFEITMYGGIMFDQDEKQFAMYPKEKYDPIFVLDHTYTKIDQDEISDLEDIVGQSYQATFNCFYNSDLFENMRDPLCLFWGKGSTKEIHDDDFMDYIFSDNFIHIANHKKNMLNELSTRLMIIEKKKIFRTLYKLHIDKIIDEKYLIKEIIDHVL